MRSRAIPEAIEDRAGLPSFATYQFAPGRVNGRMQSADGISDRQAPRAPSPGGASMELVLLPVAVGSMTALVVVLWRIGLLSTAFTFTARRARGLAAIVSPRVRGGAEVTARHTAQAARRLAAGSTRIPRDRPRARGTLPPQGLGWLQRSIAPSPAAQPSVCAQCQHRNALPAVSCERCHAPLTTALGAHHRAKRSEDTAASKAGHRRRPG